MLQDIQKYYLECLVIFAQREKNRTGEYALPEVGLDAGTFEEKRETSIVFEGVIDHQQYAKVGIF